VRLQWWCLTPTLVLSGIALAAFYVRRAEKEQGRALFGVTLPLDLNEESHPLRFRMRLASWWVFIGFGAAAALAFAVQFLGIVS
jgi:hypothetical protein